MYRCPGSGECDIWDATGGEYEEKKMVCLDCTRCKGKPPLLNQSNSPEELQKRVVIRIEDLISMENAGHLDKSQLDYFEWRLMEIWRNSEVQFERLHKAKITAMFEAMAKQ